MFSRSVRPADEYVRVTQPQLRRYLLVLLTIMLLFLAVVVRNSLRDSVSAPNEYVVTQHHQSLLAAVHAGNYDFVNPALIPQNFSADKMFAGTVRVELVPISTGEKGATASEAVLQLKEKGYRPASVSELLALGEQYPAAQTGMTIVAPGSIWTVSGAHSAVPALTGYKDAQGRPQRLLEVFGAGVLGFRTNVVFAAVKQ